MDAADPQQQAIAQTRAALVSGQAALRSAYENRPSSAHMLRGRARLIDQLLADMWRTFALSSSLALLAVGGYGRGELFPCSDVDLMILLPEQADEMLQSQLSTLIRALWDIGLNVGHSVRTAREALAAANDDITVQTNLLESRLLAGDAKRYRRFSQDFHNQLNPGDFFEAKSLEQTQRHTRFNETPYALEPNVKESPGGLRDLQMLGWLSRAAGLGRNWRELAHNRLITGDEAGTLRSAERFLRHVRIRMHYLTGREEDRLLFDYQENLARAMGIPAASNRRASEVLMQRYYQNAKKVTQINTILLQNYVNVIFPHNDLPARIINERFQIRGDLLDIREDDVFERYPSALLECFLLIQQRSELKNMTARTLRALWLNRRRINAAFRADPLNRALFLQILQQKRGIIHAFRRMNKYDILSQYLPSWRRIVGQMQHDLFHVYTVDQHILMVLRNLRRFTMGEHAHEYPLMTRLILGFERHWLLYITALFHDIAKGRGGDHSRLGMADARIFCTQHGLTAEDSTLVVWLVEHHLTMSQVAQKQDTADPEVIRRFAAVVASERRLVALYLLTHADIRGTSPKVWNGWRGKLLEDLFFATRRLLRGATPHQALGLDDRQENARRMLRYYGLRPGIENKLWQQLDAVYFMRHSAEEIAWQTRILYHRSDTDAPIVKARVPDTHQGLQVMVYTRDQPDLFVRLTGFFGRYGYSILDAKVHTTRHGYALDMFVLQDPGHQAEYRDIVTLIEHDLGERLAHAGSIDRPGGGRLAREVRHFPIPPQVNIRPDEGNRHYILSLTAADRPGLLFGIAEILARHQISVHTAKIATLGERVEDTFLLTGHSLAQEAQVVKIERELLEFLLI